MSQDWRWTVGLTALACVGLWLGQSPVSGAAAPVPEALAPPRIAEASPVNPAPEAIPEGIGAAVEASEPLPQGVDSIVLARLIRIPEQPQGHCGILWITTKMEYDLVQHLGGDPPPDPLWAVHSCTEMSPILGPDGDPDGFALGSVHRLSIARDHPPGAPLGGWPLPEGIHPWWVVDAELISVGSGDR